MKLFAAIAGGLAGAVTLTLLHQAIKKADKNAPHVDELGMEAMATGMENMGVEPPQRETLYNWTLTGDIIANTMYYSLGSIGSAKGTPGRTAMLGLLGGLGAVYLPEQLHLTKEFTNRTPRTKFLTVGLYTLGGIVAGTVTRLLGLNLNTDKIAKAAKKEAKQLKKGTAKATQNIKAEAKEIVKNVKNAKAHLLN